MPTFLETTTSETLAQLASAPGLDAGEATALQALLQQWSAVQTRNRVRTSYFDGEHLLRSTGKLGMALPPTLYKLETVLGWPAKAVTVMDNRLDLQGFVVEGQSESDSGLDEIIKANHLLVEASAAHVASMVHGVSFVTVSAGDPALDEPEVVIAARSARDATGIYSSRKRRLIAGLTVNNAVDGLESPQLVLWLDDRVVSVQKEQGQITVNRQYHNLKRTPMVMLAFQPHLERRYGVSRITRPLMALTDSAARTLLRMEGTAEFFSFPQRWVTGIEESDIDKDTFKTFLTRFLAFGKDEDGDTPQLGQFTSSSPQPHIEQLRATAMLVSGETSIPPNYLGIIQDNPASADAIRAAEADLVKKCERAQVIYGNAWCEVMKLAQLTRDGIQDDTLEGLAATWRDASTPTKAANAQSVMSLVSAGVLPKESEVTWEQLGYDPVTVSRLKADAARDTARGRMTALTKLGEIDEQPEQNPEQTLSTTVE